MRGLSVPAVKGETFRPLNPRLCKKYSGLVPHKVETKSTSRKKPITELNFNSLGDIITWTG
ncbi:hypothetical protein HS1genome_1205 [Sulfodiicoccus acidiphilus]|uniref:Uncharacterized protein n=1 Tax=Sulfodiicoccus acidiphilus TaxID=1670455 RepID=A0A348B3R4_9CREN|nr:hypothetical protein HS1genome_1205 [Sulfodiicoccus acidiphilus]GGU04269.1 hypothetical protein GCM10007116_21200 [Sulfodiicoccus acidiphilus]